MTDKKISELTSITGANVSDANDVLPIVDTSVATTKKITRAELFKSVSSVDINGGTIDGTVIGGSTPAAISGTTGSFSGAVTGTDLTLSGGVYLGGIGAANYLDGYEEGTWTGSVTVNGFTQTVSSIAGTYTIVGRLVTIHYKLTLSSAGYASGYSQLAGLPFTAASANQAGGYYATGSIGNNVTGGTHFIEGSTANFYLFQSTSTSNDSIWYGSFSYYTA